MLSTIKGRTDVRQRSGAVAPLFSHCRAGETGSFHTFREYEVAELPPAKHS